MFQEMFSENRHRTIAMRKNYPEKPWKTFVLTVVMVLVVVVYISCSRKETESSRSVQGTTFAMDTAITTTLYGGTEEDLSDTDRYLTDLGQKLDWRVEGSLTETFNTEHQADFSEFADMIETILDVAEKSNGAFDPTILSVSKLWDFGGDNQRRPSDEEIQTALSHVDHTKLTFSDGILSTTDTDVQLELGAVGKGYAIMEAADMLDRDRIPSALLSAGSSITTFGERPGQDGFRVGLRDPRGEADDLIGSIASAFPAHRVVIFSGDKDLSQVIDDRVEMLVPDPAGSLTKRGVEEVVKKFGVPPSGIVDYLALIGDASDNIPGVEGVGPKTAAALLQQFGSGEEIFRRLDEVKRESLRAKLAQAKELFEKNVKLVRLDTAPPEDVVWEICRLKRSAPDYAKIRAAAKKMELKSILREIDAIAGPEEDTDLFAASSAAVPEKTAPTEKKEASPEMTQMDLF